MNDLLIDLFYLFIICFAYTSFKGQWPTLDYERCVIQDSRQRQSEEGTLFFLIQTTYFNYNTIFTLGG